MGEPREMASEKSRTQIRALAVVLRYVGRSRAAAMVAAVTAAAPPAKARPAMEESPHGYARMEYKNSIQFTTLHLF